MHQFISSDFKLGILGGGQLGKMLILSMANYDVYTRVLDPAADCSSSVYCNEFVQGDFNDYHTVLNFGLGCNLITVEIEHVNTDALVELKKRGVEVHPDPQVLAIIKDKGLQKQFYARHALPTSAFRLVEGPDEIRALISNGQLAFPFVQKTRTAGYDGKGVKVVSSHEDLNDLLPGASVVEVAVKIKKELSVIVAQSSADAAPVAFDPVEMEFNPRANLVEYLLCPASISREVAEKAAELAKRALMAFNIKGLLAVELFLDEQDNLLINEVAPRPHNSGHHTIDSAVTSQFEQHFRSILNLPLGSARSKSPAVMGNILGAEGFSGPVLYEGIEKAMAIEGVKFHIYGKKTTKPFRKMGHFTVLDTNPGLALEKAKLINQLLRVKSLSGQNTTS